MGVMSAKRRPVYSTMLLLTHRHMEVDPLHEIEDPDAEIEQLEERAALAIATLDALRRGLEKRSFASEDPRERALLMSTLRSAEAAHVEWIRLGGGATVPEEEGWVERLLDYAFTKQKVDANNFSESVWGLNLSKDSPPRAFELAAREVLRALISHSPRFVRLRVEEVEKALRSWDPGRRGPGRPRGGTRSRIQVVHDLMRAAGLVDKDKAVSSSARALRLGRKKN